MLLKQIAHVMYSTEHVAINIIGYTVVVYSCRNLLEHHYIFIASLQGIFELHCYCFCLLPFSDLHFTHIAEPHLLDMPEMYSRHSIDVDTIMTANLSYSSIIVID